MNPVTVNVEYCGACGHYKQFVTMAEIIKQNVPAAQVSGVTGRQGSFEIQINDQLVYSKLQTLAFPDYSVVSDVVKDASEGKPVSEVKKQQPIENCAIS